MQAWADSHVNFPYHARAPLRIIVYFFIFKNDFVKVNILFTAFVFYEW